MRFTLVTDDDRGADLTTIAFCAYDKPGFLGGTSTWIQWLLPELKARGLDVRCYEFLHTGEKGPVTAHLEKHGIECITTHAQWYTEDRIRWLLERLNEKPFDVFVPNEVPAAYHAARWVKAAGIPTVGVQHVDGLESEILQSLFVFGPPTDALTAIVPVSKHIEETLHRHGAITTRIRRIPYGADVPERRVAVPEDVLRIAYVGRLTEEQKRISLVVRAFCAAAKAIPGIEATLYGDGPSRSELEQFLANEGAGLPVRLGGMLYGDALVEELLRTHVIVFLSDYEGLPVALMEAMACGCVPVCYRIPSGIPELVRDGVTGLLIDDRDAAFVDAIRKLKDDRALWTTLSTNARALIEHEYSHDMTPVMWADLLRELAKESKPQRIRIPRRIQIQPAGPPYDTADTRKPYVSPVVVFYKSMRMKLGSIRQKLSTPFART